MTAPHSSAGYDATATRAPSTAHDDPDTVRTPVGSVPAAAVGKTARTVSARIAAVIGVVAFLLGVGVSMLTGPLLGGPGGAGGPAGGQGGPPGTSQQSTTGTTSGSTSTSP